MAHVYIDPEYGDDSATGGAGDPYRTFKNLNDGSHTLTGGEKIYLEPDTTYRDELILNDSGTSAADIVIRQNGEGGKPVISGSDRANGFYQGNNLALNPSFENWTAGVPDDWTVSTAGSSTVTQETADPGHLLSSVALNYDASKSKATIRNTAPITLEDSRIYRFNVYHKDPAITAASPAYLSVVLWRTDTAGSTTGEYWLWDKDQGIGSWNASSNPLSLYGTPVTTRAWWYPFSMDIDTGTNPEGYSYYYIRFEAYQYPALNNYASKTFLLDAVSLGLATPSGYKTNVINDGDFEFWDTAGDLTYWNEKINDTGLCSISEDTTDKFQGNASMKWDFGTITNTAGTSLIVKQLDIGDLGDNTTWRFSVRLKQSKLQGYNTGNLVNIKAAVVIWRNNDGSDIGEYYGTGATPWDSGTGNLAGIQLTSSLSWVSSEVTVLPGDNPNNYTRYHIALVPYQPYAGFYWKEQFSNTTFHLDVAKLIKEDTVERNKILNPSFENWTGSLPDDWTLVQEGTTSIGKHDNRYFGDYAIQALIDDTDSDVGVEQTVALSGSKTYRLCMYIMCEESGAASSIEVAAQVKRADGKYWNGSAWSETETDAMSYHTPEYAPRVVEITTESSDTTYTVKIHRKAGTMDAKNETFYIDRVTLAEKDSSVEVYKTFFPEKPSEVYFLGYLSSYYKDHLQFFDETWDRYEEGNENHPNIYGFTYDNVERMLYINVGETMPTSYFVEGSVRDTCINYNGESYITADGIVCRRPRKAGIHLGYTYSAPSPNSVSVKHCEIYHSGEAGVLAGLIPTRPFEGDDDPPVEDSVVGDTYMTPANITVQDSTISLFNRSRLLRIKTDKDQLLADPAFEEWDTADDLTEWTETFGAGSASTVNRESYEVRQGNYSVRIDVDAAGKYAGIKQTDITNVFTSSYTTRTVTIYHKEPDVGVASNLVIWRNNTPGSTTGEYLDATGDWDVAHTSGIAIAASTTWAKYTFQFSEGANPNNYQYYNFQLGPYIYAGAIANKSFYYGRFDVGYERKDWWSGYAVPYAGISVRAGLYSDDPNDDLVGWSQSVKILRNSISADIGQVNFNTGRAGIFMANGGYFPGLPIRIEDNYITNVDHGITLFGIAAIVEGNAKYYNIIRNFIVHTGDDNCWVEGTYHAPSKIAYNIFSTSMDNGLEYGNSFLAEIYGNLFHNHANESLGLYVGAFGLATAAFVYNNVFYDWGETWYSGNPGKRRGCAIGCMLQDASGPITSIGENLIDYNEFYASHDPYGLDHPFEIVDSGGSGQKVTFAEWQDYGADAHGFIDDPEFIDPSTYDYRIRRSSPCIGSGLDLSTLDATLTVLSGFIEADFSKSTALNNGLDTRSTWPSDVKTLAQAAASWNVGPWANPVAFVTRGDGDPPFPMDKSLYGVTVFVVDTSAYRIWKGVVVENTEDQLYLDEWEAVFNAEGTYPEGSYPYYVGYIYLYDKTPEFAFINDHWEKGLTEYEVLTDKIDQGNLIFFRQSLNGGETVFTDKTTLSGNRTSVRVLRGLHRNLQQEHALVTNQEIRIKEITFHIAWKRGKIDQ